MGARATKLSLSKMFGARLCLGYGAENASAAGSGGRVMANMAYCRFRNTYQDLRHCWEAMEDNDLSADEARARERLIKLCRQIVDSYGDEDDEDD